jgi:creatinine amidohydrolase/Fe(II)-dependent formamide hydrolase-like protein
MGALHLQTMTWPDVQAEIEAEPGYLGDLMSGVQRVFDGGVQTIAGNGVFRDPRWASAAAGKKYVDQLMDVVVRTVEES